MEAIANDGISNPSISPRHLPPELTDKIINLLHADRPTLALCSLVCRSWVPASRRHLFSQVLVTPENNSYILELLSSTRCTFASSVNHLVLIEIDQFSNLSGITSRLSHVKELALYDSKLAGEAVFPPPTSAPFLCDLESLELGNIDVNSCAVLIAILYHSPRLRTISCFSVRILPSLSLHAEHHLPSLGKNRNGLTPELETLILHNSPILLLCLMANWMSATPRLVMLDLDPHSYAELEHPTEALLAVVGPSLEDLHTSSDMDTLPSTARPFAFLTHLEAASFDFRSWSGDLNDGVQFAIEALGRLPSPCLQFVLIAVPSVKCGLLDFDIWSELGSLLETPRFVSSLQSLIIIFQACRPMVTPRSAKFRQRWLQQRFPSYAERGTLKIES